ncbi:MAG: hypothetical protein A2Y60_02185 [Chloroflexi bacterium RBG_13_54_9]|nr:MAG: hypothetical protein A2Y60_02185 [Chloroflexi bacterium RBG_13_54_9]
MILEFAVALEGSDRRIDNATAYLMTAGMVQGLFEMAFDVESKVEWALSEDGNLEMEVNPLG